MNNVLTFSVRCFYNVIELLDKVVFEGRRRYG